TGCSIRFARDNRDGIVAGMGRVGASAEKDAYVLRLLGVDLRAYRAGGAAKGDDAPGGPGKAPPKDALPAKATVLYFAEGSSKLTPADEAALKEYAARYNDAVGLGVRLGSIRLRGWASVDGDPAQNQKLSNARAEAVLDFLVGQRVPKDDISPTGWGPTDQFSKDDARENRRVEILEPPLQPWRIVTSPSGAGRIVGPPLP
ncbi:MAG TPA: OmpA family protein, partial [Candidatus Limnocylindria bacterium]|nr:OmpA family protein [Candidatus Limnocylindria bacterium]